VDAKTLRPVSWPNKQQLEWCPPGHGDFYPSLLASGRLDTWLAEGVNYLFISNADNLGAVLDPRLLRYFAQSRKPFLMEVAERTTADRKGGHLAAQKGRLLLRESAQCPPADQSAFQDIHQHRYFNTNNLWVKLDALKALLERHGGFVPLPLIKNGKTVDPRDKNSPPVFQLETALGAAIGSFADAGAIRVPRSRFLPVKTTSDLLALRSDAYRLTDDWRILLANPGSARGPVVDLDSEYYRLVDQLDQALAAGLPSLKDCADLTVRGPVLFSKANLFLGKVTVSNPTTKPKPLGPGTYRDTSIELK
jgi:UDP-N-acetylglucosamine pyrophosphorylase